MSLQIVLKRNTKKNQPMYKIVLVNTDKHTKVLDYLGYYEPLKNPKKLFFNKKKALYWLVKGAQMKKNTQKIIVEVLIRNETDFGYKDPNIGE